MEIGPPLERLSNLPSHHDNAKHQGITITRRVTIGEVAEVEKK